MWSFYFYYPSIQIKKINSISCTLSGKSCDISCDKMYNFYSNSFFFLQKEHKSLLFHATECFIFHKILHFYCKVMFHFFKTMLNFFWQINIFSLESAKILHFSSKIGLFHAFLGKIRPISLFFHSFPADPWPSVADPWIFPGPMGRSNKIPRVYTKKFI